MFILKKLNMVFMKKLGKSMRKDSKCNHNTIPTGYTPC